MRNTFYKNTLLSLSETNISCSQIVAYNCRASVMHWSIVLLDGRVIYNSSNVAERKTLVIDLSILNIPAGTEFKLKAVVKADEDITSSETLEYIPVSNTVYYKYTAQPSVEYYGIIYSPLSPPVLKCSGVSVLNDANVVTKYELRTINNQTIYVSNRYALDKTWTKYLGSLSIIPATKLILHASVLGKDSEPYVILEYDPTTSDTATFTLIGDSFYTTMLFTGTV